MDWSGLTRELEAFQTTTPEELEDGLDYLAFRYTAALDKLERNYTGEELTAQRAKLEEVYQAGKSGMIEGYTQLLQDNLGLSLADMKAETMISKGLVSADMAALLRGRRTQGHENALAALDQALVKRESSLASGEPKGTFAPVDRSVFQGIYDATLNAYRQNGGDGAGAIRAGASYGQTVTAQAAARNPQALRWGISMESYWKDFYTAPDTKDVSPLEKQVNG